jgi:hypothetical protein
VQQPSIVTDLRRSALAQAGLLFHRKGTAYEHEIVVDRAAFVAADELAMEPIQVAANPTIAFWFEHMTDPDPSNDWSAGGFLLGEQLSGVATPVARVAGIALIALGIACWPGSSPLLGMLAYSALVTMYLAYLGAAGVVDGMLLWPAVVLHAILAALLVRDFSKTRRR